MLNREGMKINDLTIGGITILATYLLGTFLQAFLHLSVGHHPRGGWFFRSHVGCHHTVYSGTHLASERYEDEETSLTVYYVLPSALAGWAAYRLLPPPLFWLHAVTMVVVFAVHVYVHVQFHLEKPWLDRFALFRRRRRMHDIHHLAPDRNFAVIEPLWDRLFGTYQAP